MAKKRSKDTGTWAFSGNADGIRTDDNLRALATATKLRTLRDMPEREIKALEKLYGCPIIRPEGRNARRRRVAA